MSDYQLNVGDKVPDILVDSYPTGEIKLSDFQGRWVIVYFYPKDSTPGCTTESCEFRDAKSNFSAVDAEIIGVSRDSIKSHTNFTNKQSLNFTLVSDKDELWCKAFDVIQLKKMYGRESMGVERSTFIINPQGETVHVWRKVRVKGHVAEVLETLEELQR